MGQLGGNGGPQIGNTLFRPYQGRVRAKQALELAVVELGQLGRTAFVEIVELPVGGQPL